MSTRDVNVSIINREKRVSDDKDYSRVPNIGERLYVEAYPGHGDEHWLTVTDVRHVVRQADTDPAALVYINALAGFGAPPEYRAQLNAEAAAPLLAAAAGASAGYVVGATDVPTMAVWGAGAVAWFASMFMPDRPHATRFAQGAAAGLMASAAAVSTYDYLKRRGGT